MLSATPTKYRSQFTGTQIDSLLTSIDNKIDISYIVNDFTGGRDLVASAELAKTLYAFNQNFSNPNYIASLILSIPNAVIVYQADLDKLYQLAGTFQGSYTTVALRNTKVNTTGFKGGELTFLVNDGNGLQELSYWDASNLVWKKSVFTASQVSAATNYPTGGSVAAITLDVTKYGASKYIVKAETASDILLFELLVTQKSMNTYWTTMSYIGSNFSIAKVLSCSISSTVLTVNLNVLSNTKITFSKLTEM